MGIPLRRGREFTEIEAVNTLPTVVINEALARLLWPEYPNGQDPVGQNLLLGVDLRPFEITGIVGNVVQTLDSAPRPGIYILSAQNPFPTTALTVRTQEDPLSLAGSIRSAVQAVDPNLALTAISTMEDIVEDTFGQRRLVAVLLQLFASVALGLALIGIYGMIAYSVMLRTREIGVRMALGARGSRILRMLLRQSLGLTWIGVFLGWAGAFALTRTLKSFLFEISPSDPVTFIGVGILFTVVAVAASCIPIRRAVRLDPIMVLRQE